VKEGLEKPELLERNMRRGHKSSMDRRAQVFICDGNCEGDTRMTREERRNMTKNRTGKKEKKKSGGRVPPRKKGKTGRTE